MNNYAMQISFVSSSRQDLVLLHFSATKLDKKDLFGKSDPFLVLTRKFDGGK